MPPPQWQTGTIIKIVQESWNTRRFFIQIESSEPFHFTSGQFITLDLPIGEKPAHRWRSYSIASHPNGSNVIELLIALQEGGAGTHYLFNETKEGSRLTLRGPQGFFTLPEKLESNLFLICTGAGLAPFRSMIQDIKNSDKPHEKVFLIYGCRTQKDLLYFQELKQLEEEMGKFCFIPTLSREQWSGRTGYVHSIYEEICQSMPFAAGGGEPHPALFYLCGWKFMVNDAFQRLTQMGYDKKAIRFELYG